MRTTLRFCGRVSELDKLIARWHLASNLNNPTPQVVVIKAGQRGAGKTRLALEFYRWLSQHVDLGDQNGYWPDAPSMIDKNLQVNPDLRGCNFQVPIPYLWWGLRAGDPGATNSVSGDAVATYDRYLLLHLATLLSRDRIKNRLFDLVKACGDVGLDLASSALHIDTFVALGKGVLKAAQILSGTLGQKMDTEAEEHSLVRSEEVLKGLSKVLTPRTVTFANTPGVIFLDDAQFAHYDATLPGFIERLIYDAITQRWPLLFLVTHWKAELSPTLASNDNSFAKILRHVRDGLPTDRGPVLGLPGGYLKDDHFGEIDLHPIDNLFAALQDQLPGLTPTQSSTILDRVGGNPRYLEQVTYFMLQHEDFFENTIPTQPLTEEGLEKVLEASKSREINDIVLERLRATPEDIQEALCVASLQGMRFINDLVDVVARKQVGHALRQSLGLAEDPYGILFHTKALEQSIGQFADSLYFEAARERRKSLKSLGTDIVLLTAFRATVAEYVGDTEFRKVAASDVQAVVYRLAANLFEQSSDPAERHHALKALRELAWIELRRFSVEAAAAAYERLLAIEPSSGSDSEWKSRIETLSVLAHLYRQLHWPGKCLRTLKTLFFSAVPDDSIQFLIRLVHNDVDLHLEHFDSWQKANPTVPADMYRWAIYKVAQSLLEISELARIGPDLKIAEGDDPLDDMSFLIRAGPRIEGIPGVEEKETVPDYLAVARVLQGGAYTLSSVLGAGTVERIHFKLLEDLAGAADSGIDYTGAEEYLSRALQISQDCDDELDQIATLSNLGMITGRQGNSAASEKYLQHAKDLVEPIFTQETFKVNFVEDSNTADRETGNARVVDSIDVPASLSAEFNTDSDATIRKLKKLKQMFANICGNLAANDRSNGRFPEAKAGFSKALILHEEIGDQEGVAIDLGNLGTVARTEGNTMLACSYWRKRVEVLRELERRDTGHLSEPHWAREIKDTLECMRATGCSDS